MTVTREEFWALQAKAMTEKQVQAAGDKIARDSGWLCYHTWISARSDKGFPDSVYLRGPQGIVAEYKREGKQPTDAQYEWLNAFKGAGFEAYLWRPSDLLGGRIAVALQ